MVLKSDILSFDGERDKVIGTVWLRNGRLEVEVKEERFREALRRVVDEPVITRRGRVTKDEPERFVRSLCLQYRTPYFRATEALKIG